MIRIIDISLSFVAILLLSPLLIPIVILLRLTGEGEIFYRQLRVGKKGQNFQVLKFATMLKNSSSVGAGTITLKNDPRILPAGQFLRKSKLNELPQLLNILFGDMSFIGPRPMTPDNYNAYPDRARQSLTNVRPGLSGIGSIIFRDEETMLGDGQDARRIHSQVIAPYKAALEEWYVERQNLLTYVTLIFLTAWVVVVSGSQLVWKIFPSLPEPEAEMRALLAKHGAGPSQH